MNRNGFVLLLILVTTLLTSCGAQAWERDPDVQDAKAACKGSGKDLDYACIERRAVETLNPDVCRLAGIAIDDMCLQAVYEAANDPAICERIYLQGVRPNCQAYYSARATPSAPQARDTASPTPAPPTPSPALLTLTPAPTRTPAPAVELELSVATYPLAKLPAPESDVLDFADSVEGDPLARHAAERAQHFPDSTCSVVGDFGYCVTLGDDRFVAREDYTDPEAGYVVVTRNEEEVSRVPVGSAGAIPGLWGLWAYDGHWAVETALVSTIQSGNVFTSTATGQVVVDGASLNDELGYDETFGFQTLGGRPFYFFEHQGTVDASYDGVDISLGFDEVLHLLCCSAAAFNPTAHPHLVTFYGRKGDTWYYGEIAVSPSVSPTSPALASEGLIAFVDPEGRLSLIEPDGQSPRQLTMGGEAFAPAWSPDGETLAYIHQERAEEPRRAALYRLDTGQTKLVGAPEERLRSLAWSPDGRYLLLDSGTSMAGWIAIVEVASGQIVHESVTAVGFAWSPDGQRLALGQLQPLEDPISVESGDSVSLVVLEVGTDTPRVVLTGTSEVLYFPRAWLPDGRLLYDRLDWDEGTGSGEHSRWTLTVDGLVSTPEPAANVPPAFDREVTLARLPEEFRNESTGSFSWSPDGRWLVFHTRLDREMGVYVFDWEQGGEPVRLVDGASPAWRPMPTEADSAEVSTGTLDCVPAGTFSHCLDEILGIEFEVPASWGEIETRLRPGLDAGFAYDYYFDGKSHAETEPLVAAGRSVDFSEGRGAMPTDFGGYEHAGWQRTSACAGSGDWFSNSYPVCREVNENVAWMIRFPNASVLCEDVLGNWQTMPVFRIEISLPDNPTINGFVFEAPFFSEQFAGRVQNDLYPLLGARLDWRASKCDESSRRAFDAQLMTLIEAITDRSADAETLQHVDEWVHLAESVAIRESAAAPLPTWRHILFVWNHDGATELWTIDPATGAVERQIRPNDVVQYPALSPAGKTIAYVHVTGDYGGVASELWLMDRDGANPHSLYVPPPGQSVLSSPAWSPDGQAVYFRRLGGGADDQLLRIAAIGGEPTVILTDCLDFALSPDGQWLASMNLDRQIGIFWPDGSWFRDIEPQGVVFTDYYSLAASPHGRQVAFRATEAAAPGEDTWNLYVMNWDGHGVHRLTDLKGFHPFGLASGQVNGLAWTADGAHLVYSVDGHPEQAGIWVINIEGGERHRLFVWNEGEWVAVQGPWFHE